MQPNMSPIVTALRQAQSQGYGNVPSSISPNNIFPTNPVANQQMAINQSMQSLQKANPTPLHPAINSIIEGAKQAIQNLDYLGIPDRVGALAALSQIQIGNFNPAAFKAKTQLQTANP